MLSLPRGPGSVSVGGTEIPQAMWQKKKKERKKKPTVSGFVVITIL